MLGERLLGNGEGTAPSGGALGGERKAVCRGWGAVGGEGELELLVIKPIKANTCKARVSSVPGASKETLDAVSLFSQIAYCLVSSLRFWDIWQV